MRVMTVGTWDLLHFGHINLFRRCQGLGELYIGVNSDRFVLEYKGITPAEPESRRMQNVEPFGLGFIHDDYMIGDLERIRPSFLVVGSDWHVKRYHEQIKVTQEELDELDVSVIYVPATKGISSTQLRAERGW